MDFTLGRAGRDLELQCSSWSQEGDTAQVSGVIRNQSSAANVKALVAQLQGYGPWNTDEVVVPVTWAQDPSRDGFYRVLSVDVSPEMSGRLRSGATGKELAYSWGAELERVPGWQAPLFEVLASGADRANVHSVAAQARSWVAGPGSLDSASLSVVTTTNSTLTAAAGESVKVWNHDGNLYAGDLTYQVDESGFYDGACRVEVDYAGDGSYQTVVGRQVENLVGSWRLSNGLVRVYPGGYEVGSPPQALDLPGTAGDFSSTPDTGALDIVGDIEIRVRVNMDHWTPAAEQVLVAKWGAAGQRSYMMSITTAGKLKLSWSEDGTAILTAETPAALSTYGVSSGSWWLRSFLDVSTKVGTTRAVHFATSDDDTNDHSAVSWDETPSVVGDDTSIHSGTATLCVGAISNGTSPAAGTVYAAAVLSGIHAAGTVVADPNFTSLGQFTVAAANGTDATGKVWTHQGNADVVETGLPASGGGTVDDYAVGIFDPVANAWQTKVYNLTTGGATPTSLGVAKALTVNHNRPESASVRVHLNATGAPFIDWTIRRGSTVVEGRVEHSHTAAANRAFGVFRKIIEAGFGVPEGVVAVDDDADGHKYRIYSPNATTIATTNGGVYLTTAADLMSFGITSDARDASIASNQFYWAAQRHRQRIVAR